MQVQFFKIAVNDSKENNSELNGFLTAHKILTVQRELVHDGQSSFWAIAVEYLSPKTPVEKMKGNRNRKDYKKELPPETFTLFSKLREWRKRIAEEHGVPVYMVYTNEQLACISRTGSVSCNYEYL